MKYIKANDILPTYLINEIQKYVEGNVIYIPNKTGNKKSWGEKSGAKDEHIQRNKEICILHKRGYSIKDLSAKFYLSIETIKKIVYTH